MSHLTPVPSDPEQLKAWLATLGQDRISEILDARRNRPVTLPEGPSTPVRLTVKVTLNGTKPPVWRRLSLPGRITLDRLHDVLQESMGWTDSHLHRFYNGRLFDDPYFVTEYDLEEGDEGTPEDDVHLDQLLQEPGDRIRYEYDFGDGWEHDVRLEKVEPLGQDDRPICLAGARACPPEDVGGIGGFHELLTWHRAGRPAEALPPVFESPEDALGWIPLDWDPDAFDAADVDMHLVAQHQAAGVLERVRPEAMDSFLRLMQEQGQLAAWLGTAGRADLADNDLVDLAGPYRVLLQVIGGGVPLSKAGWLPAEYVAELCSALEIDPILAGKANRESNVKPLASFRKAVQQLGLLHTQQGLLTPTIKGIELRDDPAGLWKHIASRMPIGRSDLKKDAGWFALAALAGGVGQRGVYDATHALLVDAGWEEESGEPIEYWATPPLVWPTLDCLLGTRRMDMRPDPAWLPAAAAYVVLTAPKA